MSSSFDVGFEEGRAAYRARDYAGAESAFRRLMASVEPSDGRRRGKVAHALGLTLKQQQRIDDARRMFETALLADPHLDLARQELERLGPAASDGGFPPPSTPGGVVGVARRVRAGSEEDPWFGRQRNPCLRFRLEVRDAEGGVVQPTIELRGGRIVGWVEEGDVVEVPGPWRPGQRPRYVLNRTSGEVVRGAHSGSRIAQWVMLGMFLAAFAVWMAWVASNMVGR